MALRTKLYLLGFSAFMLADAVVLCAQDGGGGGNLFRFLGFPERGAVQAQLFNRRGNFPGTERRPPLKTIADPANLESKWDAVKVAAEVKQAEDAAPQKIKAVKYLASIGCGCYDKKMDGAITDALVAAMDDCTESVRSATIEAISEVACGEACENCNLRGCCNEKVLQQLAKIAYERDDTGCYLEPSEDVREAAVEALQCCCPGSGDIIIEEGLDIEEPERERPEGDDLDPPPMPVGGETAFSMPLNNQLVSLPSSHPLIDTPDVVQVHGTVRDVDPSRGLIRLVTERQASLRLGSKVAVYHRFMLGRGLVAETKVVSSLPGSAVARFTEPGKRIRVMKGDQIEAWGTVPFQPPVSPQEPAFDSEPLALSPTRMVSHHPEPTRLPSTELGNQDPAPLRFPTPDETTFRPQPPPVVPPSNRDVGVPAPRGVRFMLPPVLQFRKPAERVPPRGMQHDEPRANAGPPPSRGLRYPKIF